LSIGKAIVIAFISGLIVYIVIDAINFEFASPIKLLFHVLFSAEPTKPELPEPKPPEPEPPEPEPPEPELPEPDTAVNEITNQEYQFGFSSVPSDLWIMKKTFEVELPTHLIIIPDQTVSFQIISTDFVESRNKRIEIVIFEPNSWDVAENIEKQSYIFNHYNFFSFQKNFSYKGHTKDLFYDEMPCDLTQNWEPCKRSGLIDFYKFDDRLYVVHAWVDKSSEKKASKIISNDILTIMDSFKIIE